eukprot:symbB.v1.2.020782.t1/scaffold1766.1/size102418/1
MSSPRSTCRAGFLNMTPESVRSGRSTTRSVRSMRSARSGSNISVDSQASRTSSLCSRLSSLDLEEMAAEEGRRRLKSQLRRNAKSYQQAINNPDMRRGHHSLKLTVPEEFHLSVNRSERGRQKTVEVEERLRFDEASLQRFLTEQELPGIHGGTLKVKKFGYGQSNPTYCLQVADRRYVLRKQPPGL